MLIKFALVARGTFVLCEYDATPGSEDLNEVARKVLWKIPRTGAIRSYVFQGHTFNYVLEKDLIYLCVAAVAAGSELVFQFLRDFKRDFEKMSRNQNSSGPELTRMLRDLLAGYNNDKTTTKVRQMEQELEDVTDMMRDNLSKVMERGERIESLLDKTASLRSESASFRAGAKRYNDDARWSEQRGYIILAACITAVLVAIFVWYRRKPSIGSTGAG